MTLKITAQSIEDRSEDPRQMIAGDGSQQSGDLNALTNLGCVRPWGEMNGELHPQQARQANVPRQQSKGLKLLDVAGQAEVTRLATGTPDQDGVVELAARREVTPHSDSGGPIGIASERRECVPDALR
nr:hypothetical protein [Phenylobacterium sp.]